MRDSETDRWLPASTGFVMPAEWHLHAGTWLSWPHNSDTWPANLADAQFEFLQLIRAIASVEPVVINLSNDQQSDELTQQFKQLDMLGLPIWFQNIPTNDAWIRDYGPTFVKSDKQLLAIDWKYNAWGGKYPPFEHDQQVVVRIVNSMPPHFQGESPVQRFESILCLEGGAIEIDDRGLLLCTKSCGLDPHRNELQSLDSIERELKGCLGAKDIIWLTGDALIGDDTDGHIDQLARFVPGKILYAWTNDRNDSQYSALELNRDDLMAGLKRLKLDYELVPLLLPDPVEFNGVRLPASYCNFYITNQSVIVPQFDRPQDRSAVEILARMFPERSVFGLPSTHLNVGLGSFHCLTQQQPAV